MTRETPEVSAFNYYIFQRLIGVVAIAYLHRVSTLEIEQHLS